MAVLFLPSTVPICSNYNMVTIQDYDKSLTTHWYGSGWITEYLKTGKILHIVNKKQSSDCMSVTGHEVWSLARLATTKGQDLLPQLWC